jgi:hypothetical protein
MTSKANPPEIVRKSAEACAELIPSKSGERYQKLLRKANKVGLYCVLFLVSKVSMYNKNNKKNKIKTFSKVHTHNRLWAQ